MNMHPKYLIVLIFATNYIASLVHNQILPMSLLYRAKTQMANDTFYISENKPWLIKK